MTENRESKESETLPDVSRETSYWVGWQTQAR